MILVDLFIQKVIIRIGRLLQNTPQIYIVEVIYHFKLIMLQIIHKRDTTHIGNHLGCVDIVNGARLLMEDYRDCVFDTRRSSE